MTCPHCGAEHVAEQGRFCTECGLAMSAAEPMTCPHCGAAHAPEQGRFCDACGMSVSGPLRREGEGARAEGEEELPRCPACGTATAAAVCPGCGTRLPRREE